MAASLNPARVWAALAIVYVVWGSTYLGIELGVRTMPPFVMLSIRFLVAGALLYAFVAIRERRALRPPPLAEWRSAFLAGGALFLVGNGTVAWSEDRGVDTGTAALIVATVPLWLALLDRLLYGRRMTSLVLAGLVMGFGGVAILVSPGGATTDHVGELALVFGSGVWALGSLHARGANRSSPLLAASMQMLAGGFLLGVAGLVSGDWSRFEPSSVSATSLLGLVYLIVVGSLIAFSAYVWLLRHAPTSLVGTYAFVNPVIAVVLGTLFLGESLSWGLLVGGGIVVVAVAVTVSGVRLPQKATVASAPVRAR